MYSTLAILGYTLLGCLALYGIWKIMEAIDYYRIRRSRERSRELDGDTMCHIDPNRSGTRFIVSRPRE